MSKLYAVGVDERAQQAQVQRCARKVLNSAQQLQEAAAMLPKGSLLRVAAEQAAADVQQLGDQIELFSQAHDKQGKAH